MLRNWFKKKDLPTVTFATTCWERDWRIILHDPQYLRVHQIGRHCFSFAETLLVINNVKDLSLVLKAAQEKVEEKILTRYVVADELAPQFLPHFALEKDPFLPGPDAKLYPNVNRDWIYYNATGPLAAIFAAQSDYLLYMTGDVWLDEPVEWIEKALIRMEKNPQYKVANLSWNRKFTEAKRESYRKERDFFISNSGFSDQMFLVRKSDFCQPIYGEIRPDAHHFPRGDVFEKRVFSYMKNRGWERITFRHGSYTHI